MFHVDSHFVKGASHLVCQDYATSGITADGVPYVIVSDGCSSAKDSDFGSRILVRAAETAITRITYTMLQMGSFDGELVPVIEGEVKDRIRKVAQALDLPTTPFYATLLIAFYINKKLYLYARGDGTLSVKYHRTANGEKVHTVSHFTYASNAPFYMAYDLVPEDLKSYQIQFNQPLTETVYTQPDAAGLRQTLVATMEPTSVICKVFDLEGCVLDHVMISSDGLDSYIKTAGMNPTKGFAYADILTRATDYKNVVGEFIKRRVQRMEAEDRKEGIEHYDDVSVAAIVEVPDVQG